MTRFWSPLLLLTLLVGCQQSQPTPEPSNAQSETVAESENSGEQNSPVTAAPVPNPVESTEEPLPDLPVISFGGGGADPAPTAGGMKAKSPGKPQAGTEAIIAQLKDLQVLLGTWRGITQKEYDGFKAVDETEWVWDFQSQPEQPALVMESDKSPYYRKASLTYQPAEDNYLLTLTGPEGEETKLVGLFSEEITDETGDNGKPQRSYKLTFTETALSDDDGQALQLVLNQKNNDRYMLEVYRQRRGADRFFRVDTVSTQREGTSLAQIDEGYGEKTCIISGGLGTITVSHNGQTYYVCCTGCKAAFEDDPERWIARAEEQKE